MHIVFVETADWEYDIDAPLHRPLGGTQSAVCYLMKALAARGIRVSFINRTKPYEKHGVRALGTEFPSNAITDAEAVIIISDPRPELINMLRPLVNPQTKFICWMHHAPDQPAVQPFVDAAVCNAWDHYIFLSEWQKSNFCRRFPALAPHPMTILRNAIAPAFENLFGEMPILAFKRQPPVLAYTSTPFRGLDRLLYSFLPIREQVQDATLRIFSSMQLYNVTDEAEDEFAHLYQQARTMPGVDYVGPLPQNELAPALREALCLAYPNTFAETACIAVMEAMAAGCIVITSNLAALPETLNGFGVLTEFTVDPGKHIADFTQTCVATLQQAQAEWSTGVLAEKLTAQVKWVNENYTWASRAAQWEEFLSGISR